jgi:hypothetical protein
VHLRKHLVVPLDHGKDDGSTKFVEFIIIHRQAGSHFTERLFPIVFGQQCEVVTELSNGERFVQLFFRTVGPVEQRLRVGHKRVCYGAHVEAPSPGCSQQLSIGGHAFRKAASFYRGENAR